jgi:protein SCO1
MLKINRLFLLLLLILVLHQPVSKAQEIKLRSFSNIGGDFALTNHLGGKTTLYQYRGKVVILYFGYTFCPDECPNTMFVMKDVLEQLEDSADQIQILFITVDPERDTTKRLKEYMAIFDERFIGLRGDEKTTVLVARRYVTRYRKRLLDSSGTYIVDHSSYAFLIDQSGTIRYIFPFKTPPHMVVKAIKLLLD